MLNVNDIYRYPLRAADLLQTHDEHLMNARRRLAACGTGGPQGPDGPDSNHEEWKREIMALVRATHTMVSAMGCNRVPRPMSRGSAGDRPLTH